MKEIWRAYINISVQFCSVCMQIEGEKENLNLVKTTTMTTTTKIVEAKIKKLRAHKKDTQTHNGEKMEWASQNVHALIA